MYCYGRVYIDGRFQGNLEHAIEKNNSYKLIYVIPYFGWACPVCNQSFKRVGEKKRKRPDKVLQEFEEKSECGRGRRKQCTVPCAALRKLQNSYRDTDGCELILQPMGVQGKQTGEWLELQYDVLRMEFQPAERLHTYSEKEKRFICEHSSRFHLKQHF